MSQRLSRRTILKNGLSMVGAASLGSTAGVAAEPKDPPPPKIACGKCGVAEDYTVILHNTDRKVYVEGSGLAKLSDGRLVAVVPVVPSSTKGGWTAGPSNTHIHSSEDGGLTWRPLTKLPYATAIPWAHGDALYLFACRAGTTYRNDDLLLLRSDDGGSSWTAPSTLFKGHFWNCHCGMVQRPDRIYASVCQFYGSEGTEPRSPVVIAGDLTRDPLDPAAWRMSDRPPFPGIPRTLGPSYDAGWLEQSVIDVKGDLQVVCRVRRGTSITNLGAILHLRDDEQSMKLKFFKYQAIPGGHMKFSIIYDDISGLFWMPANPATKYADRRFLMLYHSLDGMNWLPAGCIAAARSLNESFMYPYSMVDGNDLITISRTSSGADGMHNADYATFHRVKNFRELALPLA
ncbi:MAG: hypothetical protein MK538_13540 [Planctomycetes bacterium]|nr:hypothetical protein [Planctomycetota bacterium]